MSDLFRIALGQMTVAETGTENLAKAVSLMKRAADAGARLLVLPEGVIARKPTDGAWSPQTRGTAGWPLRIGASRRDRRYSDRGFLHGS